MSPTIKLKNVDFKLSFKDPTVGNEAQSKVDRAFEGRDAAGKGSTIKRFTENLIPSHFSIHALGVPSKSESKYWFRRYESLFPKEGHISFFDRSWYTRALIEPTMGYCSEGQYKRFIKKFCVGSTIVSMTVS
ncbi:MAG: hypothetical protein CM15mP51_08600 [Porticoccaceae bacterium]|nr:MAG: hypothetical protein CM15mP51_08600 [Porticoccaceae bacterium]